MGKELRVWGVTNEELRTKARTEFPIMFPSGELVVSNSHTPCITIRHRGDESDGSVKPLVNSPCSWSDATSDGLDVI